MKLNVFLYVASIILLTSCDSLRQEVEPKGIAQEPEKLVIACFISPQDTVLAARVTHSLPVLGTTAQGNSIDVPNATVTLSDGTKSITLRSRLDTNGVYGTRSLFYVANSRELPIIVGKTYMLVASTPDGRKVTASCTVPGSVSVEQVLIDTAITNDFGDRRKNYFARLRWRDAAGQTNFYRIGGNNEFAQRFTIRSSPNTPPRDSIVYYTGNWFFDNRSLLTDQNRDGQEMISERVRLAPSSYSLINGVWTATPPKGKLEGHLLNVDENYYRYHDSIERQNQVRDNPFAEPVLIPSNIQGGLGCFGAYNRSTLTMTIK